MLAIDFNALCHTIRELDQGSQGITKMWKGVMSRDSQCVLLMDSKPYWRTLLYPEYKAGRTSRPLETELISQGTSFGLPVLSAQGLEADDWAGLMALDWATNQRPGTLKLLTVDTDWMQLVDDDLGIEWENLGKHAPHLRRNQEVIDWAFSRHNVWIPHPSYIGNLKRVLGDKCDNIPPNHPEPLTELMGSEWLQALSKSGFNLDDLMAKVAKVYE